MEKTFQKDSKQFEFAIYLNKNLIAKREFPIFNYIENSMNTAEFKDTLDAVVKYINDDLASKSRSYIRYYYWPDNEDMTAPELKEDLAEPWENTFTFTISDSEGNIVASKVWDGSCFPPSVLDKIDLTNKWVRYMTGDGQQHTYPKKEYFDEHEGRLYPEMYVLKQMIYDKDDVLFQIRKRIATDCSSSKENKKTIADYTTKVKYGNKTYPLNIKEYNNALSANWSKSVMEKNKLFKEERNRFGY